MDATDKNKGTTTENLRDQPGCLCRHIPMGEILDAIADGATTFREISARTGIGTGPCGGLRCGEKVRRLLEGET